MKTKEKKFRIQTSLLFLILFPLMTGMISCKIDQTLDINITKYQWELKLITINSKEYKKPSGDFHLSDAYILRFENDSILWLNLSTNQGYGVYQIPSKGNIAVTSYSNTTEIAMTDFDYKLLSVFKLMTSYTVKGNTLTFKGNGSEVEFMKK
jgi:hypothetical protein